MQVEQLQILSTPLHPKEHVGTVVYLGQYSVWILYVQYKTQAVNIFILLQIKEHPLSSTVLTALFMPKWKTHTSNSTHMEIHTRTYVTNMSVANSLFHSYAYSNTRSSLHALSYDFLILHHCIPSAFTPTTLCNKKHYTLLQNLITTYISMQIKQSMKLA